MKPYFIILKALSIILIASFGFVFNAIAQDSVHKALEKPIVLPVDKTPLSFVTGTGKYDYAVEIAKTLDEQEKGLMFRKSFPSNRAMLFVYQAPSIVTMWMKNTLLPLDMVFVDENGKVVSFAYNTVPLSQVIISSGFPTQYVVELNAGQIKKMDLKQGDCVIHSVIDAKCVR